MTHSTGNRIHQREQIRTVLFYVARETTIPEKCHPLLLDSRFLVRALSHVPPRGSSHAIRYIHRVLILRRRHNVRVLMLLSCGHVFFVGSLLRPFALLILVGLNVFRQMIAPHEFLAARRTSESLFPGVNAKVSLELVAPCETLAAEQPVADERPFAGVPSEMRLEMRSLAVDLAASGYVADMLTLAVSARLASSVHLAIRTAAFHALPAGFRVLGGGGGRDCEHVVRRRCQRPLIRAHVTLRTRRKFGRARRQ